MKKSTAKIGKGIGIFLLSHYNTQLPSIAGIAATGMVAHITGAAC